MVDMAGFSQRFFAMSTFISLGFPDSRNIARCVDSIN
jgi:hypothetical protein